MKRTLAALIVCIFAIGVAFAAAPAAATHDEANSTEYVNETVTVDNDTQAVYLDVDDTNGTTVHAYFLGIDDAGNETQVKNTTLSPDGQVTTAQLDNVDPANYSEYRVVLEGDDTTEAPNATSVGTIQKLESGGGGFDFKSSTLGIPHWIYVIVIAGLVGAAVASGKL